jgi:hypothetical protein
MAESRTVLSPGGSIATTGAAAFDTVTTAPLERNGGTCAQVWDAGRGDSFPGMCRWQCAWQPPGGAAFAGPNGRRKPAEHSAAHCEPNATKAISRNPATLVRAKLNLFAS